jgi:hypothetical protein
MAGRCASPQSAPCEVLIVSAKVRDCDLCRPFCANRQPYRRPNAREILIADALHTKALQPVGMGPFLIRAPIQRQPELKEFGELLD